MNEFSKSYFNKKFKPILKSIHNSMRYELSCGVPSYLFMDVMHKVVKISFH